MSIHTIEKTASPASLQKLQKAVAVMKYLPNEQQIVALMNILQQIDTQATTACSARPETKNSTRQHLSDMIRKVFYQERLLEYTHISDVFHQPVITILRDLTTRSWHASFLLADENNMDFRGPFLIGNDIEEVQSYSPDGPVINNNEGQSIPLQNQQDGCYFAFDPSLKEYLKKCA